MKRGDKKEKLKLSAKELMDELEDQYLSRSERDWLAYLEICAAEAKENIDEEQ